MVHFEDAERELVATPVAPAFLLAEPDVHGLPVGHRNVDVGAGCYQPVAEQVAHGLLQAHVDQLDGLG